jgi:hypothetical protein
MKAMMLEKHTTKNGIHCSSKRNKEIRELNINKLVNLLQKKYTLEWSSTTVGLELAIE